MDVPRQLEEGTAEKLYKWNPWTWPSF